MRNREEINYFEGYAGECLLTILLFSYSFPLLAIDQFYNPELPGCLSSYSESNCWQGGIPPSLTDDAYFSTGAPPAAPYTVNFDTSTSGANATVTSDSLIWNLAGNQ